MAAPGHQHFNTRWPPPRLSAASALCSPDSGEKFHHLGLEALVFGGTWADAEPGSPAPRLLSAMLVVTLRQPILDVTARRISRRPGPLKIEAAKVAGDIADFADEIKPGDGSGFEGFRG